MIMNNKRKIMTYPFYGLDYSDIKEIGDRVCVYNGDLLYLTTSVDKYNTEVVDSNVITDERLKGILYYFYFLNQLCRKYFNKNSVKSFSGDYTVPSFNTYIDTVLITVNEMISVCKYNDTELGFSDIFNCSLDSDCLSSIYNLLMNDSYTVHASKYRDNGVVFDKIMDGTLNDAINDVVRNKNSIMNIDTGVNEYPVVLKKTYGNKVI